jgi:hypothetical protein
MKRKVFQIQAVPWAFLLFTQCFPSSIACAGIGLHFLLHLLRRHVADLLLWGFFGYIRKEDCALNDGHQ